MIDQRRKPKSVLARLPEGALRSLLREKRRLILSLACVAVLLVGIGFVTHGAMTHALQDILAKNLHAVIEADITALTIWMENEKRDVRQWAERDVLASQVKDLLVEAGPQLDRQALLNAPSRHMINRLLDNDEGREFMLMNPGGLVIASDDDSVVGLQLGPDGLAMLDRAWGTDAYITHPFHRDSLFAPSPSGQSEAWMMAISPVRDENDVAIAALAFVIDPKEDFTRILSVARIGETGNTYAFNSEGLFLSESRFDSQLREIGLLPDTPRSQSILRLRVRDPGGDMTTGYEPEQPPEEWPLTLMAAAAVTGRDGMNLEGYRDYRGVRVAGIWRWLPDYQFGVATEVTLLEALRVVRPVTITYWILLSLAIIGGVAVLAAQVIIMRLNRRIRETQRIDRYTLERKLGEGGMSEVYLARHQLLRRATALKLLPTEKIDPQTVARFEREVQLTSRLTHPNTIVIHDYGRTREGIFYYAMEYVDGITLAQLIEAEGALPPARAVYLLRQVCASLQEAHAIGLIHRDIKPANILLCQMGGEPDFIKVLDFGLVRDIRAAGDQPNEPQLVSGTPIYISPERLGDAGHLGPCCDIYSLGVLGYNLLTGQDPYQATNVAELTQHSLHDVIPRPSKNSSYEIPAALDELIVSCMAKKPSDRPATVHDIIERLDAIIFQPPWDWRQAKTWWEERAPAIKKKT